MATTKVSRVSWLFHPTDRTRPRASERHSGSRMVTRKRERIQTRERKDLVRFRLHVQGEIF